MTKLNQSIKGFASGFKTRELQNSLLVAIALIVDITPLAVDGFIVCQLEDGTYVNVHAWGSYELLPDQTVAIIKISQHSWNGYILLAVNASTDREATPFSVPSTSSGSLPVHAIGGDRHSGNLDWNRINTGTNKVDLASQVTGILPLANQMSLEEETSVIINQSVTGGATVTGEFATCKRGMAVSLLVTGGSAMTLTLYRDAAMTDVEYQTVTGTVTPFRDGMVWYHSADASKVYWEITNDGSTATLVATVMMLVIE